MTRGLAQKLEAATDFELGEEGRDVELYGAFGEIQFASDLLVGETAKYAIEDFLFPTRKAHGAFDTVPGLEKLLSLLGQAVQAFRGCRNHDEIVFG